MEDKRLHKLERIVFYVVDREGNRSVAPIRLRLVPEVAEENVKAVLYKFDEHPRYK